VEVLAPVRSAAIRRAILDDLLAAYLRDTLRAWEMLPDGSDARRQPGAEEPFSAQARLMVRAAEAESAMTAIRLRRRRR
jgi:polyphosphate kinase